MRHVLVPAMIVALFGACSSDSAPDAGAPAGDVAASDGGTGGAGGDGAGGGDAGGDAGGGDAGRGDAGEVGGDGADGADTGVGADEALRRDRLERYCGPDWEEVEGRVDALLAQMTLEEKVAQTAGTKLISSTGLYPVPGVERLGIPGLEMVDGPRGVSKGAGNATAFPVGAARGATFDPELERRVGAAMGREARAKGASVLLAPTINLLRHPRWGRAQETYGEDPVLLGDLGTAFVQGVQSERVLASAKHFAANSIDDTRFKVDVQVSDRALRELYLPHFRQVVEEGNVASVMSAYNKVNGLYCSENPPLLRDILKGEWGFMGFVESDWVFGTYTTVPAAEAGLDIEMPFGVYFGAALGDAVAGGALDEAVVDEAVRRIVRAKLCYRLDTEPPVLDAAVIETAEHRALAREVAARSIVLLKNVDDALPLDPATLGKIAVVGPLADRENIGDLGSSAVAPSEVVTALEGLVESLGPARVVHVPWPFDADGEAALAAADAVIAVVGLTSEDEGEGLIAAGDRESLALPGDQAELIAQAVAQNPQTIVVLEGGGAVVVRPWVDDVAAVLMAWYPGMEGGHALADVLLGVVNPSGRLPHVFPVAEADLPPFDNVSLEVTYDAWHGYRHLDRTGVAPEFPFGFGLSYTQFEYLAVREVEGEGLAVEVDVKNAGDRGGIEVVQLYVGKPDSAVERAPRELKAFAAVSLEAGETRTVRLDVPWQRLAIYDGGWRVEPGEYAVEVGASSRDLALTLGVTFDERAGRGAP